MSPLSPMPLEAGGAKTRFEMYFSCDHLSSKFVFAGKRSVNWHSITSSPGIGQGDFEPEKQGKLRPVCLLFPWVVSTLEIPCRLSARFSGDPMP